MTEFRNNSTVVQTIALLTRYGFDMRGYNVSELLQKWLNDYQSFWIRLAVIEALYQGRYKAISVEQILTCWLRRGSPAYHFTHEFERLVCRKFPRYLTSVSESSPSKGDEADWWVAANEEIAEVLTQLGQFSAATEEREVTQARKQETRIGTEAELADSVAKLPQDLEKVTTEFSSLAREGQTENARSPIHQFIPSLDESEFYFKLKAVAQVYLERQEDLALK